MQIHFIKVNFKELKKDAFYNICSAIKIFKILINKVDEFCHIAVLHYLNITTMPTGFNKSLLHIYVCDKDNMWLL